MQKDNNVKLIAFVELMLQWVLFSSICYAVYFGVLKLDESFFMRGFWVPLAVTLAFFSRKFIRKFRLFILSNILIMIVCVAAGQGAEMISFNVILGFLICAYSTGLKNREVRIYNDNSIPIREGQNAETVRDAAIRSLVAKEAVSIYFVAVIVVGYFLGVAANNSLLMNIESFFCIVFIILQIVHNNLKQLNYAFNIDGAKADFPASQIITVSRFVMISSVLLIAAGMLLFYNGYYGNIFYHMGAGFMFIFRMVMKFILFLMSLSGREQTSQEENITETEPEEFIGPEPLPDDNDFMELLAEIFGVVLIVGMLFGIIYLIKTYASAFNKTRKVNFDTVEHVASKEKKSKVTVPVSVPVKKDTRNTHKLRKLYKKSVLNGTSGNTPDTTLVPSRLTSTTITSDEEAGARITILYEKARYSMDNITDQEIDEFKRISNNG